ncbi:HAD family hydrolase [Hyunsoonleella pacifica]|uniref:phosphoglycolate phosphatase n=1 Tax=Hyunsoonleella pacifica TaxID=1080224 RepID=A0A4Q9FQ09_9FLAO|nr:HAD family hydrolase [Hyunsoonleella pacifica]TBN15329.1 HAD family hydrolase [Hyunsoonleella pacifica]GGD23162.1 phosphoglycolate phosphatase [Hyunsoonleella pacifica]
MKYKAVIFDLDGTLVNSIYDIADAMNEVLLKRKYKTFDYETYKTFVGHGVKSLIIKAVPEKDTNDELIEACLNDMMAIYSEVCTNKTKTYDGVLELLETLHSKNVKLSVLSNKEDSLTKKVVTSLLPNYVNPTIGLKEERLKKPNPEVLLKICNTLKVKPEDSIYVGDTNVDIKVAKNANMFAVGVSWGFRDKDELIKAGADYILNTPADLLKIL